MTMAAAIDGQARAEQAALVARVGNGDEAAFRELAELYARPMHRLSWRMLFDSADAEQVVREAFARLWVEAPRWRKGDGRVGGWLYRACTKLCLDRLRRRGTWEPALADGEVVASLAALTGQQRAAIVLTRCEALPNAVVADILRMTLTAFESLLSESRMALLTDLRRKRIRVDSLNQLLDEVRPAALPSDFAARIAAESAAGAPRPRTKAARDRRGAWIRHNRTFASVLAGSLLVASVVAAAFADRRAFEWLPTTSLVTRFAPARDRPTWLAGNGTNGAIRLPATAPPTRTAVPDTMVVIPMPAAAPAAIDQPGETSNPLAIASNLAPQSPARQGLRSHAARPRLAATASSHANQPLRSKARKKRLPHAPIPLLPPGFADSRYALAAPVNVLPTAAGAQGQPLSAAALTAERRERMRTYLRALSPEELKQLRKEERALRRQRRENRRNGLAQLPANGR